MTSSTSYHFSFPLVSSLTRADFNLTGAASNLTGASFNLTGAATSITGAATSLIGAAPADTKPTKYYGAPTDLTEAAPADTKPTKYYGAATDLTGAAPADTKPTMIEVEVDEDWTRTVTEERKNQASDAQLGYFVRGSGNNFVNVKKKCFRMISLNFDFS